MILFYGFRPCEDNEQTFCNYVGLENVKKKMKRIGVSIEISVTRYLRKSRYIAPVAVFQSFFVCYFIFYTD